MEQMRRALFTLVRQVHSGRWRGAPACASAALGRTLGRVPRCAPSRVLCRALASGSNERPTLRAYQEADVTRLEEAIAARTNTIYVLPTGGGKTVTFAELTRRLEAKGKRTLIIVHRLEIMQQTKATLEKFGVFPTMVAAGQRGRTNGGGDTLTTLAMVQTLSRRGPRDFAGSIDCIIIDEAHHAVADSYMKLFKSMHGAVLLGITATPFRLDGSGLGKANFAQIIEGPTMGELVAQGHLVPFVYREAKLINTDGVALSKAKSGSGGDYMPNDLSERARLATNSVVEVFIKYGGGRSAIAFAVDVEHSQELCAAFNACGVSAEHVDGSTLETTRERIMQRFTNGEVRVLTNCQIAQEGFDAPVCSAIIMARPTKSRALFLQMAGRGLRTHAPSNKKDCLFLDVAGLLLEHGLPTDLMHYTLEDGYTLESGEKECKECSERDYSDSENLVLSLESVREWRSIGMTLAPAKQHGQYIISWEDVGQTFRATFTADEQLNLPLTCQPLTVLVSNHAAKPSKSSMDGSAPTFNVVRFDKRFAKLVCNRGSEQWLVSLVRLLAQPDDALMRDHFEHLRRLHDARKYRKGWVYHRLKDRWGVDAVRKSGYKYEDWSYDAAQWSWDADPLSTSNLGDVWERDGGDAYLRHRFRSRLKVQEEHGHHYGWVRHRLVEEFGEERIKLAGYDFSTWRDREKELGTGAFSPNAEHTFSRSPSLPFKSKPVAPVIKVDELPAQWRTSSSTVGTRVKGIRSGRPLKL